MADALPNKSHCALIIQNIVKKGMKIQHIMGNQEKPTITTASLKAEHEDPEYNLESKRMKPPGR